MPNAANSSHRSMRIHPMVVSLNMCIPLICRVSTYNMLVIKPSLKPPGWSQKLFNLIQNSFLVIAILFFLCKSTKNKSISELLCRLIVVNTLRMAKSLGWIVRFRLFTAYAIKMTIESVRMTNRRKGFLQEKEKPIPLHQLNKVWII